MDSMIKIIYALTIYSASLQSSFSVQVMVDSTDIWEARVRATLTSLQNHPCWGLSRGSQCDPSIFNTLDTRKMRLYTAEGRPKIRVVLPDRKQRRLTHHSHRNDSYDAAFVLDPLPDANFGHLVFIFLVDYNVNKTTCNKSMNGVHVSTGKCRALWYIFAICVIRHACSNIATRFIPYSELIFCCLLSAFFHHSHRLGVRFKYRAY